MLGSSVPSSREREKALFHTKRVIVPALLLAGFLGAGIAWLIRTAIAAPGEFGAEDRPPAVYALLRVNRDELLLPRADQASSADREAAFALQKRTQAPI